MTKQEAFAEINKIQDYYIDELVSLMNNPDYDLMKTIDFTSATGTGKTKMMSKLINRFPDDFFIITTLSKGQLHHQIRDNLRKDCNQENFIVYGSADYKINSRLDAEDIIGQIPEGTKCIWLRDEGHIRTNRFDELLMDVCYKVINFSATNIHSDIQCNFTQTMMLRTVNQTNGTPEEAIEKLLEVKEAHKDVPNYNPCAIFRCVGGDDGLYEHIISLCKYYKLNWIDITEDPFIIAELCEDDNEYDVIINKFKIVEGIDIRRAHVLYMDNQPSNNATTIQVIGRCRRNALLYRNDIDILSPENENLLKQTRECYVYYNVERMRIDTDADGELYYAFCDHVSCESLKANTTISVVNGQLSNGLYVIELEGKTGSYDIITDQETGFNVVSPTEELEFYRVKQEPSNDFVYSPSGKIRIPDIKLLPEHTKTVMFDYSVGENVLKDCEPYYLLHSTYTEFNVAVPKDKYNLQPLLDKLISEKEKFTAQYITDKLSSWTNSIFLDNATNDCITVLDEAACKKFVSRFIKQYQNDKGLSQFCKYIQKISDLRVSCNGKNIQISKIFNDYAILLLQYYLIEEKDMYRLNNSDIKEYVQQFIEFIEQKLMPFKDNVNWAVSVFAFFSDKHTHFNDEASYHLQKDFTIPQLSYVREFDSAFNPDSNVILQFLKSIDDVLLQSNKEQYTFYPSKNMIADAVLLQIENTVNNLKNNILDKYTISYNSLFEPISDEEQYQIRNGFIHSVSRIEKGRLPQSYKEYTKTVNDRESAIIGVDLMHQIDKDAGISTLYTGKKHEVVWTESKTVSSKVGNYNKFNTFLSKRYQDELEQAKSQCFTGKNNFQLDSKCNSVLGYCVEYYSKYLVYGPSYLGPFIINAQNESQTNVVNDGIIIRACMLKYKQMMMRCFGASVAKIIKGISTNQLIQEKYRYFVDLVVELGTRTANYVKEALYSDKESKDDIDPNLSIEHITGLADYITEDTILDVKVRNNIDDKCVRQVLAYHYLSTKRSDLHIKKVIVYDAVSDKAVVISIGKT